MIKDFSYFRDFITGKSVLIIGGGPAAGLLSAKENDSYEVIIRLNNFKAANECRRTDIWYSYFGRNIKNVEERIKNEDIKMIVSKYPANTDKVELANEFYKMRLPIWESIDIPVCYPTESESFQINNPFGVSPSCGFSAIFDVLNNNPAILIIVGFDFFESNMHNLNEKWDGSGGHHPNLERKIIQAMEQEKKLIWLK